MAFALNEAFNATAEIADSAAYPGLRLASVNVSQAASPQPTVTSLAPNYTWTRSQPSAFTPVGAAPSPHPPYFSAACYFFGRDLYVSLGGEVPIGLVVAAQV